MTSASVHLGERARALLRQGALTARALMATLGVSQPTLSRALKTLGDDLVPFGAARSIQYTLRDTGRQDLQAPVYRVTASGQLQALGRLVPVCPDGFVMVQADGTRLHTEGLPWWLYDMRPQGYLGRAYNQQYGGQLGLPPRLADWHDTHALRAMLRQGADLPGNLLMGDAARDQFINMPPPQPIPAEGKAQAYAQLAAAAARGEHQGSSAAGEQPKFTAFAECDHGAAHVIVKFSAHTDNPISQRWRDLLQAEHQALQVLSEHGVAAARSSILHQGTQTFLEVQRFDRDGPTGRRALLSMAALDAEFVGSGGTWPQVVRALAGEGIVTPVAVASTQLLWAFGSMIANTDMHSGNLSFMSEQGRPYQIAPAYDMTCMAFAPTSGGDLPERPLQLNISADVPAATWHQALAMAQDFVHRLQACSALSKGFEPCLAALVGHVAAAADKLQRLG